MNRREFLKTGMTGIAFLSLKTLGCSSAMDNYVGAEFDLTIGAGLFEMIDGRSVFMWSFEDQRNVPRMPGPVIQVKEGDPVRIHVYNSLKENHSFAVFGVPGTDTGPIAPGESAAVTFNAPAAGTYLYLDPLNAPVNRVLGLHGAMIVMPKAGNTPYSAPTAAVQQLFNDLGTTPQFPKFALSPAGWDPARFRIWLQHQIDPVFNAQAQADFLAGRVSTVSASQMLANFLPRYFTINGRSGVFAAHDPAIALSGRIGQPMLVRILNSGLFTHSNHIHANHVYVIAVNNTVQDNVFYIDTFAINPLDRVDWLVPFIRPPDIAGNPNTPLRDLIPNELALTIQGPNGSPGVPQSPLGFPMHCHVETSQTAAGGNYPQGTVTHFDFLGDVDGIDFRNVM